MLPAAEHPASTTISGLAHEFALKDYLDGAWAARPLELVRSRGRTLLLLECRGTGTLDSLPGKPLELEVFLKLAPAITHAIGRLHERGLVHKDIKPAHILLNPVTEEVWLTGFGRASRLPRERQVPEPPEFIAGTLAYMSPEQTGRMNRSTDSRSDLYSLGITFYADRLAAVRGDRSHGIGSLPHRQNAGATARAGREYPSAYFPDRHEARREDCRGALFRPPPASSMTFADVSLSGRCGAASMNLRSQSTT